MTSHIPAWLNHAVIYQIYPQSFSDSNGDGIGDLQGVIDRLDYIQSLGVDVIWLNPFFDSPFNDAGYDVRDYYKVAPRYGTNEDFKRLCDAAHQRGLKVIFDLVIGHCSWENEWFLASGQEQRNQYSDWFIWTNSVWRGAPGLEIIRGYLPRNGGYVTNFYVSQPALNFGFALPDPLMPWQQPMDAPGPLAVRAEVKKIISYWFDLGADGYRADMALSLVKGDPDGRFTAQIWDEINSWLMDNYPEAACIAEGGNPAISVGMGKFHVDFCLPWRMASYNSLYRMNTSNEPGTDPYSFSVFGTEGAGNIERFMLDFLRHYQASKDNGFISIPVGNHDIAPRISFDRSAAGIVQAFLFSFTMPGVPSLYYGDEIGMRSIKDIPGVEGSYERNQLRTPMQWDNSKNAGFSTADAESLYLPLDPAADRPTVAAQEDDPHSLLNQIRALIKVKRETKALAADAAFEFFSPGKALYPIVYARWKEDDAVLVAMNPTDREVTMAVEWAADSAACLFGQEDGLQRVDAAHWKVTLRPESGGIYRKL